MIDLKGKKVGLVLSGGGAKGIYQVGMLKAMEEHGLEKKGLSLSGTSIGAMNALQYACGNTDSVRDFIFALGQGIKKFMDNTVPKEEGKKTSDATDKMMERYFPDNLVEKNTIPVYACVYSSGSRKPEYYRLNGLPGKDQRDITLASGSIPGMFPPVPYKGCLLSDGAVLPLTYEAAAEPDKIPVRALANEEMDIVFVSYLKPEDRTSLESIASNVKVVELRPGKPLEYMPGTGTMDFSDERLKISEAQGYSETTKILNELTIS